MADFSARNKNKRPSIRRAVTGCGGQEWNRTIQMQGPLSLANACLTTTRRPDFWFLHSSALRYSRSLSRRTVNQKRLPEPGTLVTPDSPPIKSTNPRVMASPSPNPSTSRVALLSPCSNREKRRGASIGSKPLPVSATSHRICTDFASSPTEKIRKWISPFFVKLIALFRYCQIACSSAPTSPTKSRGKSSIETPAKLVNDFVFVMSEG